MDETEAPVSAGEDPRPLPPPGVTPHPVEAAIDRWFADYFHGSAVARNTICWNVAHRAKEALKPLMRKLSGG